MGYTFSCLLFSTNFTTVSSQVVEDCVRRAETLVWDLCPLKPHYNSWQDEKKEEDEDSVEMYIEYRMQYQSMWLTLARVLQHIRTILYPLFLYPGSDLVKLVCFLFELGWSCHEMLTLTLEFNTVVFLCCPLPTLIYFAFLTLSLYKTIYNNIK